MGSAAKPAPDKPAAPRLGAVEREILRCAEAGETADFTKGKWARARRIDGRVAVSGKFLSDLWLGLFDARVHPVGITIKGLHIEGPIALGGARVDARLRTPLVGLSANSCRFDSCFTFANARVESLCFSECEFAAEDEDQTSIMGASAEIIGEINFHQCEVPGYTLLRNAVIDDNLAINGGSFGRAIAIGGAEIRGDLLLSNVQIDQGSGIALELFDAVVAGNVRLTRCRFTGAIAAGQLHASSLLLHFCSLAGPTSMLNATFANVTHNIRIVRSMLGGGADLSGAAIGGQLYSLKSVFGGREPLMSGLVLASAHCTLSVLIDFCRIHGGINAPNLDAGQVLRISNCVLPGTTPGQIRAEFTRLKTASLAITNAFFGGQILLSHAALGQMTMSDFTIDMSGRSGPRAARIDDENQAYGLFLYAARIERDVIIASSGRDKASWIDGGVSMQALEAGGQVVLRHCWIGRETMPHSFHAWGIRPKGLLEINRCVLPAGFYAPNVVTADLRLTSIVCSAPLEGAAKAGAIVVSSGVVTDSCTIGCDGEDQPLSEIAGTIYAADAEMPRNLALSGITTRDRADRIPDEWAGGSSFSGAKLGDVVIGGDHASAPPTLLVGCLAFDRATIKSLRLTPSLTVSPRRRADERHFANCGVDDITRDKWGVALSLFGATIERRFKLMGGTLGGMVDLKNLTINELVDKGGEAWRPTGVEPGQLRLDGLTYSDLDDDSAASSEGPGETGSTARPRGVVARRLDWLAMQYPGGEADSASFTPQPYEQLARHYAALGDERGRRQVLVRKRQLQRRHSGLGWIERAVSGLLGVTSDYGYSPGRASLASTLLVVAGALAAWGLHALGAITPKGDPGEAGVFSPLLYAFDVAVPFLDLGHDAGWRVDPGAVAPFPGRTLLFGIAEALYRLAGVVMLSITVLTFSGILHEKD